VRDRRPTGRDLDTAALPELEIEKKRKEGMKRVAPVGQTKKEKMKKGGEA